MKRIVNILALFLALFSIFALLVSCEKDEPVYDDYTVTVVDGVGTPVANVMVKFTDPNGETKTRVTDKSGLATIKNVLAQDYKIVIEKGLSEVIVDNAEYSLTEDVRSLKVVVRDESKTVDIYGEIPDNSFAYNIGVGTYDIPCGAGQTTYYVFYAQSKGVYKISLTSNDDEMTVGYYGIPMFVQTNHRADGEYDGKSFELVIQDPATPYVLGITASRNAEAHLTVERSGDAPFDPQFAPWTTVSATEDFKKCNLPADAVLNDIDVTDSSVSVTLGDDGYYYTSDGKLVYLRINSISDAKYLDVSIAFIAGFVDDNIGQNFGGYVYNEDGSFEGKYSFNDMIASYMEYCSGSGLYPLTAELARAIQVHGNSIGWWNPNAANYLFSSVNEVTENAWLFLCCTVE